MIWLPLASLLAAAPQAATAVVAATVHASDEMPVPADLAKQGVKRFRFDGWAGPALPVWYLRPRSAGADAPVLFVFHGVQRDADRYIAEWTGLAEQYGVVIVVPEFTHKGFPGARGYNHGALFDADGKPQPRALWSYSVLEPLFDAITAREKLSAQRYQMFGHSAGAQFVHRFVLMGGGPRLELAVSANAGSYAITTDQVDWPFGMRGVPEGAWNPAHAYAQPMVVLLGTADIDPNYPSLPRDPQAMAQGPYRLARGQKFYRIARADAAAHHQPFHWRCGLVPGVGHDDAGMAPYAMALITHRVMLKDGADCAEMTLP